MKVSDLFSLLICLSIVSSCTEAVYLEQDNQKEGILTKSSGVLSVEDSEKKCPRFTEEMLATLIDKSSFKGNYSIHTNLKTRSANKAPGLYIVNFDNGGWMIVAGNVKNENQVLAYSETGSFNPDNIENAGVQLWYDMVCSEMDSINISTDTVMSRSAVPGWIDMNEDYYWVRLALPVTTEVYDYGYVAPLLNTKWGQGAPWNTRTPNPSGDSFCFTGCCAVSCAQILYYLKQSRLFNIGLYESVTGSYVYVYDAYPYYTINPSSVQRSNYQQSSNRWVGMRKTKNAEGRADWVADLMFDVAEHLGMKYFSFGSGTTVSSSLFQYYGVICDQSAYDFNKVRQSLDSEIPVEVSCGQSYGGGHSWVIDGYSIYRTRTDNAYQWKLIPPDSLSYYDNIDYDYVLSENDKQIRFPDVEENEIEHNYSYYSNNYLIMNWGWDGVYDNGHYSINPNWQVDDMNFNQGATISYNFRQQ